MRSLVVTTAALSLLASSALSESNQNSFAQWIEDSYSPCQSQCVKNAIENKLGDDCGNNALSSSDAETIDCICKKFDDESFATKVRNDLGNCEAGGCDKPSNDQKGPGLVAVTSRCIDISGKHRGRKTSSGGGDRDAAPLTNANLVSVAGAALIVGVYLL